LPGPLALHTRQAYVGHMNATLTSMGVPALSATACRFDGRLSFDALPIVQSRDSDSA